MEAIAENETRVIKVGSGIITEFFMKDGQFIFKLWDNGAIELEDYSLMREKVFKVITDKPLHEKSVIFFYGHPAKKHPYKAIAVGSPTSDDNVSEFTFILGGNFVRSPRGGIYPNVDISPEHAEVIPVTKTSYSHFMVRGVLKYDETVRTKDGQTLLLTR